MLKRTIVTGSNALARFRKLALVSLVAMAPASAFANIVTYDFTLNGGSSGPLAGVTSSGHFSYDDQLATPGGHVGGVGLFTDFFVQWAGITYDESIVEPSWLGFDWSSNALANYVTFGTNCVLSSCSADGATYQWFAHASLDSDYNTFIYQLADQKGYTGSMTFSRQVPAVPEPGTMALMLAGFAGFAAVKMRRRRDANIDRY